MQSLYRFLFNPPWPLSRCVPCYMEDENGILHRTYKTTPAQRYVGSLLIALADTPPHQLTLHINTPLPTFPDFPSPLPFPKVAQELIRISGYKSSISQGIYHGENLIGPRLPSTDEMTYFTLRVQATPHKKPTTLHIQLNPTTQNFDDPSP